MTSSLVGSEMCIRDSSLTAAAAGAAAFSSSVSSHYVARTFTSCRILSVSYTHLTLPTICSV
eukprot:2224977-Prorocentrum_lima.AAC.1